MSFRRLALCTLVLLPLGCGSASPPPAEDPASRGDTATPAATGTAAPETQAAPMAAQPPAEAPKEEPAAAPATDSAAVGSGSGVKGAVVTERLTGGTYSAAEVKEAVLKSSALFDKCYLIGAGNSPQFVAKVTVQATVGPSGTVTVSQVKKSTANNKKVDDCVADAFKKIKFPQPRGAATSVITFPIEFNGAEEVRP